MDNYQPQSEPTQAWEYAIDAALLLGAFLLLWFALHVAGMAPAAPLLHFDPEINGHLQTYIYILAAIGLSEYVMLQVLIGRSTKDSSGNSVPWTVGRRAIIRAGFAGAVWVYILVVHYLLQPA